MDGQISPSLTAAQLFESARNPTFAAYKILYYTVHYE
jgi:hypothetical protein